MTRGTCSPTSPEPSASYDPASSSWRTSAGTFDEGSMSFTGRWPTSGMTRRGLLFALPTPELPTDGSGSSSLLPTPVVNDMGAGKTVEHWDSWREAMRSRHGNGNGHGPSLSIEALRLLKTPTSNLGSNGGSQHPDKRKAGGHGPTLADEVEHLLGVTTPRPSNGGNASPDLLPAQLSLDELASD